MIAFLGAGLLGAGFVRALRRRGDDVTVWNRSPEKARALEAFGARAVDDPESAVRGASRVHVVLSDDAAVDAVLARVTPCLDAGAIVVDHTTTSPPSTAARAARLADAGVAFLHAPVFMGPQNALESTGVMLASGDRARFDALAPHLAAMTGRVVYVGPQPERAAAYKLLGNLYLMFLTTGLADMLSLGRAMDVAPAEIATLLEVFNPGASIRGRLDRMTSTEAPTSWALSMARKDARIMLDLAASQGAHLAALPSIAAEMDRFIARGHGADDWTVLGRDAVSTPTTRT